MMVDVSETTVLEIEKDLCVFFNQETSYEKSIEKQENSHNFQNSEKRVPG